MASVYHKDSGKSTKTGGPSRRCCPYEAAPEQKARVTYDNILRLSDDPDVNDVIKFLRQREVVHFQRFGEALQTETNGFTIYIFQLILIFFCEA